MAKLPQALERVPEWARAWRESGRLVLLLDFDGTLAPIVAHADLAAMPQATRAALERLRTLPGVEVAIVSGRGLGDARTRAAIPGITYAGNHGMEIEGPGIERVHPEALAARPMLEEAVRRVSGVVEAVPGAFLEDKGLTLSVHFRQAEGAAAAAMCGRVRSALAGLDGLRLTEGKMVLEVRPRVDWNKGRAVLFLLEQLRPPGGAPILFFGDDRTDEDAFRALRDGPWGGEGVLVAEELPEDTAARAWLPDPEAVGRVLAALAAAAPG